MTLDSDKYATLQLRGRALTRRIEDAHEKGNVWLMERLLRKKAIVIRLMKRCVIHE